MAYIGAGITRFNTADELTVTGDANIAGDIKTEDDLKVEVASGGIYTITGTDTASNRTLTLPDEAGTVLTSVSSIPASSITGLTQGITSADIWRNTATVSSDVTLTSLEQPDDAGVGVLGTSMSVSSGVFTFPSTGIWLILTQAFILLGSSDTAAVLETQLSTDGGSNWNIIATAHGGSGNADRTSAYSQAMIDVTDTSNWRIRFVAESLGTAEILGNTSNNRTSFSFIRLGDT